MPSSPTQSQQVVERLHPLIGTWRMDIARPLEPAGVFHGKVAYELMPGGHFLVQRWEVDDADSPDGVALIGFDPDRDAFVQHCYDSHGATLVYEMSVGDGNLQIWRITAGFSERFTGVFRDRGNVIRGGWEKSDDGVTWEPEFDLICTKVR